MTPWLNQYQPIDYTLKAIKEGEKVDEDELPEAGKFEEKFEYVEIYRDFTCVPQDHQQIGAIYCLDHHGLPFIIAPDTNNETRPHQGYELLDTSPSDERQES